MAGEKGEAHVRGLRLRGRGMRRQGARREGYRGAMQSALLTALRPRLLTAMHMGITPHRIVLRVFRT
jgi:hypothetical protein